MKKKRKIICLLGIVVLVALGCLYVLRISSDKQIDDVSPEIACEKELLQKSDILYIIPYMNNKPISENKVWCDYILSLNKTLALHGVSHTYLEFKENRNQEYLIKGMKIFKECFNKEPLRFKPPQLAISRNNRQLIKNNMILDLKLNHLTHKVYHCKDSGIFSNKFIDWF